jgi:hypothetical protein
VSWCVRTGQVAWRSVRYTADSAQQLPAVGGQAFGLTGWAVHNTMVRSV